MASYRSPKVIRNELVRSHTTVRIKRHGCHPGLEPGFEHKRRANPGSPFGVRDDTHAFMAGLDPAIQSMAPMAVIMVIGTLAPLSPSFFCCETPWLFSTSALASF